MEEIKHTCQLMGSKKLNRPGKASHPIKLHTDGEPERTGCLSGLKAVASSSAGITRRIDEPAKAPFFAATDWACLDPPPDAFTLIASGSGIPKFCVDILADPQFADPEADIGWKVTLPVS